MNIYLNDYLVYGVAAIVLLTIAYMLYEEIINRGL